MWDTATGLPEESIYSVIQTPDRYLWLANNNGLVRYDGSSFQTFHPRHDLGGAMRQEISRIGMAPDGGIWVSVTSVGLVRFDGKKFRRAPSYPEPCTVRHFLTDGDGVLVVCAERILHAAGERVRQVVTATGEPRRPIQSAARDSGGRLWVGYSTGGLSQPGADGSPAAEFTTREGFPAGPVNAILSAGANRVWAGTENGLALVGNGTMRVATTADGLPSNNIRQLTRGADQTVWVGTTKGVALRRQERFEIVSALPSGQVEAMFEDREENLWIAFADMRLYRLHKPKFLNWGRQEGLGSERPRAILPSGDSVWVAQDSTLTRLRHGRPKSVPIGQSLVRFLEKDAAGRIWLMTPAKVFILDPETERMREVPGIDRDERLFSMSVDLSDRMWLVGEKGIYLAENGRFRKLPIRNLPPTNSRSHIRQSRDGRYWLSVERVGLFELGDGRALQVNLGEDPELNRIHTFYIDSSNDFWLGLDGGGLARWRDGKAVARFGSRAGRPHNFVYYLAEDTDGYLWLGLRAGLLRVRKDELNAYLDGEIPGEPRVNIYDISDGLRSYNFGGALRTVAAEGPARVLWLPNLLGFVRIDSREVPYNKVPPPVHILEVSADDRTLPLGNSVTIPAGAEILGFRLSAPTLGARNRVQIRYRLEPFDQTSHTVDFRSVSYTRVPPGKYTFSVSASNHDGVWNEAPTRIGIVVEPQFFQTWWFRLLIGFGAMAGAAGLFRWRTAILRREKANLETCVAERTAELSESIHRAEHAGQAKADFLATMSHEIRTPMHGVLGLLEMLSETGLNSQQSEYLNTARTSSTSLLGLLNDILDLSKMEAGRMELRLAPFSLLQTIEEVTRLLQAQANLQRIALTFTYDARLPRYFKGDEMRIRQIVFNLAGNAVKFTTEGSVDIRIGGEENGNGAWSLRIAICDTGIGIPTDRIPELFQNFVQVNASANRRFTGSGLGLAICQRLATMMGGTIAVESEVGRGSAFTFAVELPSAPVPSAAGKAARPIEPGRSFDANVLVAEDNPVNQRLAVKLLTDLGCKVTLARNGKEAVRLVEEMRFGLILMDCQMPEMDGYEASRLIRDAGRPSPPIVAVTANALPGDREKCLEAGMNDYLAKPFQKSDLIRLLDFYLPVSKPAGEPAVTGDVPLETPRN